MYNVYTVVYNLYAVVYNLYTVVYNLNTVVYNLYTVPVFYTAKKTVHVGIENYSFIIPFFRRQILTFNTNAEKIHYV